MTSGGSKPGHRNMLCLSALAFSISLAGAGCLTSHERDAFDSLREVERISYSRPERQALPELTKASKLSDYLAYAALNSPRLEAAFYRWKAALERIPQVRSLPDPRFQYAWFLSEVEPRGGAQRQKFGLSQTFPWFGKLKLRGSVAFERAEAERARYEAAKLALFRRVREAWYEYYYLSKATAVVGENVVLLKRLEQVVRTKYKTAGAGQSDLIRVQVELGKLDDRRRTLLDLRGPLSARLDAALGRPAGAPLPWPREIPEEELRESDAEIVARLRGVNPELRALAAEAAAGKAAVRLARREGLPDITLHAEYAETNEAIVSTFDSGKDAVAVGFSINLPLWRGKYRAAPREARARLRASETKLRDREVSLDAEVRMALYAFRDAKRRIDLYRYTLIPKGQQSLSVTEAAFRADKASFLDLIDAQRTLLEFRLSYERALADHARALARLEALVGSELPRGAPKRGETERETETPARRSLGAGGGKSEGGKTGGPAAPRGTPRPRATGTTED